VSTGHTKQLQERLYPVPVHLAWNHFRHDWQARIHFHQVLSKDVT
jgi:hypothetical protein